MAEPPNPSAWWWVPARWLSSCDGCGTPLACGERMAFRPANGRCLCPSCARHLGVTQAAVSQQVKALEGVLGLTLFNRERQRLVITEAGREYLAVVRDALDRIAVGTDRLVRRQSLNNALGTPLLAESQTPHGESTAMAPGFSSKYSDPNCVA